MTREISVVSDPLEEQLHGFTRSLTEIQWLTLVLVLLNIFLPEHDIPNRDNLIVAMGCFGTFILVFSYSGFFRKDAEWKLAAETWAMIAFITYVLLQVGHTDSILTNLYLLVIITASLTLGKLMTLLEVALITACFMWLDFELGTDVFTMTYIGHLLIELGPLLLVAYLTAMLASDIHHAHDRIRSLAGTDELTGLLNLRGFNSILQREHEQAVRYARRYSVAILDVDNMKVINDMHGHEAGNQALRQLSAVLRRTVRSTDAAARFGGDEFVMLLVESTPEASMLAVRRIRKEIEEIHLRIDGDDIPLRVSVGFANYPRDGATPEDLLRHADVAMYEEKQARHESSEAMKEEEEVEEADA